MAVLTLTAIIILLWLLCSATLIGLGLLTQEMLQVDRSLLGAFFIGWGAATGLLELYHLFRPIDATILLLLVAFSLAGLFRSFSVLRQFALKLRGSGAGTLAVSALVIFLIGVRSTGPCLHYDTGLYGATAVRWLTAYRVLPGIANLYGRLGFNFSFFLSVATLRAAGLGALSYRIWDGLILAVVCLTAAGAATRVILRNENKLSDWFMVILSIPLIFFIGYAQLPGTDTDLPAALFCFAGVFLLLRGRENDDKSELVAASVIFGLAIVFKVSIAAFAAPCCLVALWGLWLSGPDPKRLKRAAGCVALLAEIFVCWISAGYIQSGYPMFPIDAFGLPVSWRVPDASVRMVLAVDNAWAHVAFVSPEKTAGWRWLIVWYAFSREEVVRFWMPLLTIAAAVVASVILWRKSAALVKSTWAILLFSLIGIATWFFSAPDLRFIQGPLWALAALLGAIALHSFDPTRWKRGASLSVCLGCLLAIYCATPTLLWSQFNSSMQVHDPDVLFPSIQYGTFRTRSGLLVQAPLRNNQCWDAPLPCTPYLNLNLELRDPNSLQSGFRSADFSEAQWNPYP